MVRRRQFPRNRDPAYTRGFLRNGLFADRSPRSHRRQGREHRLGRLRSGPHQHPARTALCRQIGQLGPGRTAFSGQGAPDRPAAGADARRRLRFGENPAARALLMPGPALFADLLEPSEGRLARAFEITFVCMMVVIVSMMYQIPEPAISTYLIFFAAKENSGLNILMCVVLIVFITLVVAIAFGLAILTLNSPEGRIVALAGVAFVAFFLGASSKLAPLASTMGLIVAYVLDLLGSTPLGEIATRGLLYAWLFVVAPMLVFL